MMLMKIRMSMMIPVNLFVGQQEWFSWWWRSSKWWWGWRKKKTNKYSVKVDDEMRCHLMSICRLMNLNLSPDKIQNLLYSHHDEPKIILVTYLVDENQRHEFVHMVNRLIECKKNRFAKLILFSLNFHHIHLNSFNWLSWM